MKNAKKLALVLSLSAMALGFSTMGAMAIETSAATSTTNYFTFINGASVRLVDDSMGEAIRFQSTIGEDYYDDLKTTYTNGETVTLKSVVTDANDATKPALTKDWVLVGTNAIEINFNDVSNEADFYHAIVFEDVFGLNNPELTKLVSALDLKAEMYIEVNDGVNEPTTISATNGVTSVVRSARAVANKAYDTYKDDTEENSNGETKAERLEKYFGTRTEVEKGIYFEAGDTLTTVISKDLETNFDLASAKVYTYKETATGTLPTVEDFASTLGNTATVGFTLFDENNNVLNVPAGVAMYVTKALKTEADLAVFNIADSDNNSTTQNDKDTKEGYYVLANNITNEANVGANMHEGLAYTDGNPDMSTNKWCKSGLYGTFDGQGYTMAFDVYQGGLFGIIRPGSVIKNVGMDVTFTNNTNTISAIIALCGAGCKDGSNQCHLSDIYVNVDDFRSNLNSSNTGLFALADGDTDYINMSCVIMNYGNVVCNADTVHSGALYMYDGNRSTNTARFNYVYTISGTPMWMSMDSDTTRGVKMIARSDCTEEGGTTSTAIANVAVGTQMAARGATLAAGNIYYQNAFRYNSEEDLGNAIGSTSREKFTTANGWTIVNKVPVWATFSAVKNA